MKSFNQVLLLGHVAAPPNCIKSKNGKQIVVFPIAVNRDWPESIGEKEREVDYHKVVTWNKLAEIASKHVNKGAKLLISGKLVNHCYEESEGETRYMTEVHANSIEILTWPEKADKKEKKAVAKG